MVFDKGNKLEEKTEQQASQEAGRDAVSINIEKIENKIEINYKVYNSDLLSTKPHKEEQKGEEIENWNKEELIFSLQDFESIDKILNNLKDTKEITKTITDQMKDFFLLLNEFHKGCLLNALKIIKHEKELEDSENSKDVNKIIKVITEIEKDTENVERVVKSEYGDYNKMYNILRSDDLQEKILPKISELLQKHGTIERAKEEFSIWWDARLLCHPYIVWVHDQKVMHLNTDILSRFANEEGANVQVIARGSSRIKKAKTICNYLIKEFIPGYKLSKKNSQIGSDEGIIITFVKEDSEKPDEEEKIEGMTEEMGSEEGTV